MSLNHAAERSGTANRDLQSVGQTVVFIPVILPSWFAVLPKSGSGAAGRPVSGRARSSLIPG
ncbi:MAG: hypothetical protein WCB93_09250 [Gallionella sp.]